MSPCTAPTPRSPAEDRRSLRRKLSWGLLSGIAVLWLLLAAFGLYGVYRDARALANAQLDQTARVLLAVVAHEIQEDYPDVGDNYRGIPAMVPAMFSQPGVTPYDHPPTYVARLTSGTVILHSADAGPLLKLKPTSGYSDYDNGDESWRVLTLSDPEQGLTVTVAQTARYRQRLANALALRFIVPLLIALPLLGIIVRVSLSRGLRDLQRLAERVAARSTSDRQPLTDDRVPSEAQPLTLALDDLLARLQQVREREQRFIADAAHELRTPLAGIKTQGQVARLARNAQQRDVALDGLVDGVDRATRLVSQLLTLARLDPGVTGEPPAPIMMLPVVQAVVGELARHALASEVELAVIERGDCAVAINETLLGILLRNLLENAIHASRPQSCVTVEIICDPDAPVLVVRDQGPGIDPALHERVFERFYRGPGSPTPGAGLGLSIVKRIAEQADANLTLENLPEGGLRVKVRFAL